MLSQIPSDAWEIAKAYGVIGIVALVLILVVWKGLLPYIKKQHEEHLSTLKATHEESIKAHQAIVEDARRERDYVRLLHEKEVDKFLDSLKLRDEKMERGFDEVVRALQDTRRK